MNLLSDSYLLMLVVMMFVDWGIDVSKIKLNLINDMDENDAHMKK